VPSETSQPYGRIDQKFLAYTQETSRKVLDYLTLEKQGNLKQRNHSSSSDVEIAVEVILHLFSQSFWQYIFTRVPGRV
jgi:hypothetical protein